MLQHHTPTVLITLTLSTALTLSACSLSTSSSSSSASPGTETGTSRTPPTAGASAASPHHSYQNSSEAPDWGVGAQGQQAAEGSTLTIADVRVGNHPEEGYTRLVLVFDGQGAPGWQEPRWDVPASTLGKENPISVEGAHTMIIRGSGMAGVPPDGQQASGHRKVEPGKAAHEDQSIDSAYVDPGFEGEFQVVVGTDSQTYRVFSLSSPTRLVIDIAYE